MDLVKRIAALVAATFVLVACGGCSVRTAEPDAWISSSPSRVVLLSWTDTNGHLTGTVRVANVSASGTTKQTASFTGSESIGSVTLAIQHGILGGKLAGTVSGSRLTIVNGSSTTLVFSPSSNQDFTTKVSTLEALATSGKSLLQREVAKLRPLEKTVAGASSALADAAVAAQNAVNELVGDGAKAKSTGCGNSDASTQAAAQYQLTLQAVEQVRKGAFNQQLADSALNDEVAHLRALDQPSASLKAELDADLIATATAESTETADEAQLTAIDVTAGNQSAVVLALPECGNPDPPVV
jgi:hypothetical protein